MTTSANEPVKSRPAIASTRMVSVDLLRGLVMVIMALDHVRDFFSNARVNPTDVEHTTAVLFVTRWITHFCAPVFVFLAGTGAFLSLAGGKPRGDLARFLLTRGAWLLVLEFTIVRFGWFFNFDYQFMIAQVIWALGWSMIVLSGLIFLPNMVITLIGVVMIAGHNLLDGVQLPGNALWTILHKVGGVPIGDSSFLLILYPLIPWVGVMAVGYTFGTLLIDAPEKRQRNLLKLGGALTLAFIVIRAVNVYGDPFPWTVQKDALFTVLSFLNCHKYPPSLLYLLMTLGPGIMLLALFDRFMPSWMQPIVVFGRVPMFYYLLHMPLIHGIAWVMALMRYGRAEWLTSNPVKGNFFPGAPDDIGYDLPWVYVVWVAVVLMLYPLCRWFAKVKARNKNVTWLSYL